MVTDTRARLRQLSWYREEPLRRASVLLAGVGALGLPVAEHLARAGVGTIVVVDKQVVATADLSRSYAMEDIGQPKAQAAARRLQCIAPDLRVFPIVGELAVDVGLGWFMAAEVVLGCLDGRRARAVLNEKAWQTGRCLIDGGLNGESLLGSVRIVQGRGTDDAAACLECPWTSLDYELLETTDPCTLARPGDGATSSTIAGITAALQAQLALEYVTGRGQGLVGQEFLVSLRSPRMRVSRLRRNPGCRWGHGICLDQERMVCLSGSAQTSVAQAFAAAEAVLGPVELHLGNRRVEMEVALPAMQSVTPTDFEAGDIGRIGGGPRRASMRMTSSVLRSAEGQEMGEVTLGRLGLRPGDLITARAIGGAASDECYLALATPITSGSPDYGGLNARPAP